MDYYMTFKQASEKWGISHRMINYYCSEGRIVSAEKAWTILLVPNDAEKPEDKRYKDCRDHSSRKDGKHE